jgi:hypothetical protein
VPIASDTVKEGDETFFVDLSNPRGGPTIGVGRATGTIVDDSVPSLGIDGPWVSEEDGSASVRVYLTAPYSQPITVYYQNSDGTATSGANADYTPSFGPLTFQPGQTELSFAVPITNDRAFESTGQTEQFNVSVSAADARIGLPTTNKAFVYQLYSDLLQRPVDPDGLAAWASALGQTLTPHQVAVAVLGSGEYLTRVITGYYNSYLLRAPDTSGMTQWLSLLPHADVEQEDLQVDMLASLEYYNHPLKGKHSNAEFVRSLYQDVLRRPADSYGLSYWTNALSSGALTRAQVAILNLTPRERVEGR